MKWVLAVLMILAAGGLSSVRAEDSDVEHLFMEGTSIQGSLDKPHVVYIVPWKEVPEASSDPLLFRKNFKADILVPVDRDQFNRMMETPTMEKNEGDGSRLPGRR
jgi:hypothetical protein